MVEKIDIPFRLEIKIYNDSGDLIYHFRPAKNNVEIGMRVTRKFVKELGVIS